MTDDRAFQNRLTEAVHSAPGPDLLPGTVPVAAVTDLIGQFATALRRLNGELVRASGAADAAAQLLALTSPQDRPWFAADRPLVRALAAHLPVTWVGREELAHCQAALTEADWAIADTGTVGLSLDAAQPRACYLLPEVHVAVVMADHLLPTLADALARLAEAPLPTAYVYVSGPSRTADIEKTIVIPAHGPKRLIVVLLEVSP